MTFNITKAYPAKNKYYSALKHSIEALPSSHTWSVLQFELLIINNGYAKIIAKSEKTDEKITEVWAWLPYTTQISKTGHCTVYTNIMQKLF